MEGLIDLSPTSSQKEWVGAMKDLERDWSTVNPGYLDKKNSPAERARHIELSLTSSQKEWVEVMTDLERDWSTSNRKGKSTSHNARGGVRVRTDLGRGLT